MGRPRPLNKREKDFCRYMLTSKSKTQAAIQAGYSKKSAGRISRFLSSKLLIQQQIEKLKLKAKKTDDLLDGIAMSSFARRQQELEICALYDPKDFYEIGPEGDVRIKTLEEMGPARRAIAGIEETRRIIGSASGDKPDMVLEVKTKLKFHDKLRAIPELAKQRGEYPEEGTGETRFVTYAYGSDADKKA